MNGIFTIFLLMLPEVDISGVRGKRTINGAREGAAAALGAMQDYERSSTGHTRRLPVSAFSAVRRDKEPTYLSSNKPQNHSDDTN